MAYGATVGVWGEDVVSAYGRDLTNARILARQDLVRLAANLSRFEPVAMLVDTADDEAEAREFLARPMSCHRSRPTRSTLLVSPLNDLWARDTGPVFVTDSRGALHGVNLNFNGWGQ